jgi:predicted RNA-binding protein
MCLAKAFVQAGPGAAGTVEAGESGSATGGAGSAAAAPLMENVTQVEVKGDEIVVRSLFGERRTVRGRIASIDFADGKLILEGVEA